ncbi:hypothetical protein [Vibrio sp. WXL210]|uniref:hypothetical protein n=1 Tax=Vibrio sp. WXL210 TaxID=3450709 RepID=UPI003EC69519
MLTTFILIISFLVLFSWANSAMLNRERLADLTLTKGRPISEKERQLLYLAHKKRVPCQTVYVISGPAREVKYGRNASQPMLGNIKLASHCMTDLFSDEEDNIAEVVVYRNRAYVLSINGHSIEERYGAEWDARFAPLGKSKALNIEIHGQRPITDIERYQLEYENRNLSYTENTGLVLTFCSMSIGLYYFMGSQEPVFSLFAIISIMFIPLSVQVWWVTRQVLRSCTYKVSCANTPGRSVVLAKGRVRGIFGAEIWFHNIDIDPKAFRWEMDSFRFPSVVPPKGLKVGQTIEFGFCASDAGCHKIVFIQNHFDAAKEYQIAPYAMWGLPEGALIYGLTGLLVSVPLILGSEKAEYFLEHWYLVQLLFAFGATLTLVAAVTATLIYRRVSPFIERAKAKQGMAYRPFSELVDGMPLIYDCEKDWQEACEREHQRRLRFQNN